MPEGHDHVRLFGLRVDIERQVYTTVVLMSVLVVYDGWHELASFLGVAAVIVAPVLAILAAHFFSEVLEDHSALCRPLTGAEWLGHARHQGSSLWSALPPLVVLGIGWVSPLDVLSTITVLVWTGVATLMVLAGAAAARAGYRGWRLGVAAIVGAGIGLLVVSLQILLKPH